MARLEFFVVSRSVSVDQGTNQISVFEVIEEIHTSQFPAYLASCVAISLWLQEPGDDEQDFQQMLRITSPSGTIHELPANFRLTQRRHRVTQRIEGLLLEQEGKLRFETILNTEHKAEHVVDIIHSSPVDAVGSLATAD